MLQSAESTLAQVPCARPEILGRVELGCPSDYITLDPFQERSEIAPSLSCKLPINWRNSRIRQGIIFFRDARSTPYYSYLPGRNAAASIPCWIQDRRSEALASNLGQIRIPICTGILFAQGLTFRPHLQHLNSQLIAAYLRSQGA